jgi:diguanylate cyclase (GGDEF)-like protein/PAS domain S-box-containing protein
MPMPGAVSVALMADEEGGSFQFLAENSTDVICRAGADMSLLYVSPSSVRILGWKPEEMTGQRPDDFVVSSDVSLLSKDLVLGLDEPFVTVRMRKKNGTVAWVEIKRRMVGRTASGEPSEIVIVIRDVTGRKVLEERLSLLELTDSRTGLFTHRAFDGELEREWNRAVRDGTHISLLLLDFDHFRQFHDLHREGDRCLSKAAAAVIGAVRVTDFAALCGTEDVAIILPATGPGGAAKVAEKVQAAVQALRSLPSALGAPEGRIALTIGMATVSARPGATARMPEILRLGADSALQKAKGGRIGWPAAPLAGAPESWRE